MASHAHDATVTHDAFISYARKDGHDYAVRLQQELEALGFKTWRDERDIDITRDFTWNIESAIRGSRCVIVCQTPETLSEQGFVRREVEYARLIRKPILVCHFFADMLPIVSIATHTYLDFVESWEAGFGRLCERLRHIRRSQDPTVVHDTKDGDPFRNYVKQFYEYVGEQLQQMVVNVIDLNAQVTPMDVSFWTKELTSEDDSPSAEYITFGPALERYGGRVLLLGQPGAGKTITLLATARDAATQRLATTSAPLPLYAPIPTWNADQTQPLVNWLCGLYSHLNPSALARELKQGTVLLFLDGLDELAAERPLDPRHPEKGSYDPRLRFLDLLGTLPSHHQIIVTSRTEEYEALGAHIPLNGAVALQPLNDEQIIKYLAGQPILQEMILRDAELHAIARTPLLLSLLVYAFDQAPDRIPAHSHAGAAELRDVIFSTFVEQRLSYEKRRAGRLPLERERLLRFLGELALRNASTPYTETNLLRAADFHHLLSDHDAQRLQRAATRLHLLARVDHESYRFIHVLLRDHFAFNFACTAIYGTDSALRYLSVRLLGQQDDARALDYLLEGLNEPDADFRKAVVHALGDLGDLRAIDALLLATCTDEIDFHEYVGRALARIGARHVALLTPGLYHQDKRARWVTARALGFIGAPALNYLLHAAIEDDATVSEAAGLAILAIGEAAIDPLRQWVEQVEGNAATILESLLNDLREAYPHHPAFQVPDVPAAAPLSDYTPRSLPDIYRIEHYINAAGEAGEQSRQFFIDALVKLGTPAIEGLIRRLGDESQQKAAVAILVQIGAPAVARLIEALAQPAVNRNAAYALIGIGTASVGPLIEALRSHHPLMRFYAVEVLGRIGDTRALRALEILRRDTTTDSNGVTIAHAAQKAIDRIYDKNPAARRRR